MYTVTEVGKMLGFTRQTVINWIKKGKLKAVKVDKEYRISEEEVERLKRGE